MEERLETRVRINLGITAKGYGQWEITSEFPTVEQSSDSLSQAIDSVRAVMAAKGIKEAGKE